jgi:hypothetical protein
MIFFLVVVLTILFLFVYYLMFGNTEMIMERNQIKEEILKKGRKVERRRSWLEASEAQRKGILTADTPYGKTDWFYIHNEESIWWIYYDASDGGIWNSKGPLVTGFLIDYHFDTAKKLTGLESIERNKRLAKNDYAKVK